MSCLEQRPLSIVALPLVSSAINSLIMSGMMGAWRERGGPGPS